MLIHSLGVVAFRGCLPLQFPGLVRGRADTSAFPGQRSARVDALVASILPLPCGGRRLANSLHGFQSRSLSSCRVVCRLVVDNEVCFFMKYSPPENHCVLESSCVQHSGPRRQSRNNFISCSCTCFNSSSAVRTKDRALFS